MTIDPRWSVILSISLAILSFLSGASSTLTDAGLDPVTVKHVIAWILLTLGLGNSVNAVLGAIPSKSTPAAAKTFWLGPKETVPPQPGDK